MRILFHSERYWPVLGGVETLLRHLAQSLLAAGHSVVVVTNSHPDRPQCDSHNGVSVQRLAMTAPLLGKDLPQVVRTLKEYEAFRRDWQPDLVHLHFSGPSAYYAFVHPVTTVTSVHDPLGYSENTLTRRVLTHSRRVVAVSDFVARRCRGFLPECPLVTVPNALPRCPWPPAEHVVEPARFLCIGRLVGDKGFDLAIEALPVGTELEIVGQGPERERLENLAQGRAVHFLGPLADDEVVRRIDACSAVVMPSRWEECFGLVALEAMSRGRPVIATRRGGLTEVVTHEVTGLLFEWEDGADLRAQMVRLRDDPALCRQLGKAALGHPFCFEKMLAEHLKLYQECLNGGRAAAREKGPS